MYYTLKTNIHLRCWLSYLGDKDDKDNTDNKNKLGGRKANDQGWVQTVLEK